MTLVEHRTSDMAAIDNFDAGQLRRVLGRFFTGVTVVTTIDATSGNAWGVTANSFTSVSLEPPLILWNQALAAPSHRIFDAAKRFAVNILSEHQIAVSQRFSRPCRDKFEDLPVTIGLGGIPLLEGCCAVLECRKVATHAGGDHAVFIGQVERMHRSDAHPLIFGDSKYMAARPRELL